MFKHIILPILLLLSFNNLYASEKPSIEKCLHDYSLRFGTIGKSYYSGGFIGNGILGATIYEGIKDTLVWELGRVNVVDRRKGDYPRLYKNARLPIGKFLIPMQEGSSSLLIDLHKSEVSGKVNTNKGFSWRTLTPHQHNVYVLELTGKQTPDIIFRPEVSVSPRFIWNNGQHPKREDIGDYAPNPKPSIYKKGKYTICKQPLTDGGEYTTVWYITRKGDKQTLVSSIAYSQERTDTEKDAIADIEKYLHDGQHKAEEMHLDWWHNFYSRSYVHVGEERYDRFFWSQLYKLGSATRVGGYAIDLMGPWYHNDTPWPAIWWNLNIQLTYSPMFAINHSDLVLPMMDMIDQNIDNILKNVPHKEFPVAAMGRSSSYDCVSTVTTEHGLFTWTLFYYWKYCQYTNDRERLSNKLFPLLKYAINYYRTLLFEGADDKWHMPLSHSPEYKNAEDCNFELAILRWGCQTLIDIDNEFGINDELLPIWKDISGRLTDYVIDQDGFMIGKDVKLTEAHRHYSHLLMLYPLNTLDLNDPENATLARKSIEYWLSFTGGYYVGYTYTGASSMCTLLGEGEKAYDYLNVFFDKYIQPNTFYKEAGPVFETPMSALASYMEMLLLSKKEEIRIMPAVPDVWQNIQYERLLAEGGYEVSATRENGRVTRVKIKSLYGGKCRIYPAIDMQDRKLTFLQNMQIASGDDYIDAVFDAGEELEIIRK
ncbi:MAG: hypothetical protein E6772_08265 [Dysgonomonas sp.]|nr:hypothetical protein [Dysgonomonas sp.]